MFNAVQALPLRERRIWCPRISHGGHAEYPPKINHSWTWHWPVHGLDPARDRTRTGTFRVRKQSTSALSPRQQSWPRTIHVHAQATASIVRQQATVADENCPQTVRDRVQSATVSSPQPRTVHDRIQSVSLNSPRRWLQPVRGQSGNAITPRLEQSANRQRQQARTVRSQSAVAWGRARESEA
jgi:hypothetical protein